jgi:hypothetical protein
MCRGSARDAIRKLTLYLSRCRKEFVARYFSPQMSVGILFAAGLV